MGQYKERKNASIDDIGRTQGEKKRTGHMRVRCTQSSSSGACRETRCQVGEIWGKLCCDANKRHAVVSDG